MSILDDIKVLQGHIVLAELFNTGDMEVVKPMYQAMKRVADYAYEHAKKEFLDNSMDTLTNIMKGDKQNETH